MNKPLLRLFTVVLLLTGLFKPGKTMGQCACEGGVQPDSIIYTFTLNPTSNFSSAMTFPKFDPAVGTLNCITFMGTINAVANVGVRNLDSVARDYEFLYTQAIGFSGPGGLSASANTNRNLGPDPLDAFGGALDSIHYGPDTTFKNRTLVRNTTNVTPYLGTTGTVTINFTNTGSTLLLQGSNNYSSKINTFASGDFRLAYYWCENNVLATNIRAFSATRNKNTIDILWSVNDEKPSNTYEIQLSQDGRKFSAIAERTGSHAAEGATAKYHYQYNLDKPANGQLYFRIRQTAGTRISYSPVRTISLQGIYGGQPTVFPNPAIRQVQLNFDSPVSGNFEVALTSPSGQRVYTSRVKIEKAGMLRFSLPGAPPPGLYYLHATDVATGQSFSSKLVIGR